MQYTSLNNEYEARPFQKDGLHFLDVDPITNTKRERVRGLIGDETGLGKTVQSLLMLLNRPDDMLPCLNIVKAPTMTQWTRQIRTWFAKDFHAVQIIKGSTALWLPGFKIYLISMDTLRLFVEVEDKTVTLKPGFQQFIDMIGGFKSIIFDECQGIKNSESQRGVAFDAIQRLCGPKQDDFNSTAPQATGQIPNDTPSLNTWHTKTILNNSNEIPVSTEIPHFIGLSATAITGSAEEYYTVLHVLDPKNFGPNLDIYRLKWLEQDYKGKWSRVRRDKFTEFHNLLKKYVIRRKKVDVLKDLPEFSRTYNHIKIEDARIKKLYNLELDKINKKLAEHGGFGAVKDLGDSIATLRRLIGMAKALHVADAIAADYEDNLNSRKLVIGMHHQDSIALMVNALTDAKLKPLVLDGSMNSQAKDTALQTFRNDPTRKILILSMLAGGVGIDGLQHVCSEMITVERQWRAAHEEQYEGRLHRDGQKEPVNNEIYVALGTIDEYMDKRVEQTRKIVSETLDGEYSENEEYNTRETAEWAVSHRM